MQTRKQPSSASHLTLIVAAAVADLFWIPLTARGQALSGTSLTVTGSTTLQGNVSVTGTNSVVDFYGNSLYLGTSVSGSTAQSGISALYTDGDPSKFSLISARPAHQWSWGYFVSSGSSTPLMTLDGTNGLTVYDSMGNSVVLSPASMGVSGVATLLTQQAADSRYVSSENFTVGSASYFGGTVPTIALTGGTATGPFSFAGMYATASGYFSNASGYGSFAGGDRSTASGYGATASGWGSNASGFGSTASGGLSTASGYNATASGDLSTAIGRNSNASGWYSNAIGDNTTVSGWYSNASGFGSTASGWYANASGIWPTASGNGSNANGNWSNASGDLSTAIGFGSTASGYGSTASGFGSIASGLGATSAGYGTIAQGLFQTVVGVNNIPLGASATWCPTDPLFVIGNGTVSQGRWGNPLYDQEGNQLPDLRSNALVVNNNGDTTLYGKFTVSGSRGGLVVTGTAVPVTLTSGTTTTKIIASGTTPSVLIPEQGDLSMGDFVNGAKPSSQ